MTDKTPLEEVLEFLSTACEKNAGISRRQFFAGLAGLSLMFMPKTENSLIITPSQQEAYSCRQENKICPKVFGQHWGLWRYDQLTDPHRVDDYDWARACRDIDHIATYANTLAVHSSMLVDPSTGELSEMPDNSRRTDALNMIYDHVKSRHPSMMIMDKLHLELPDKSPRTWMKMDIAAAQRFFEETYCDVMMEQARIAQSKNLDFLSIACELDGLVEYTKEWEKLLKEVRREFQGIIVYSGMPLEYQVYEINGRYKRGYRVPGYEDVLALSSIVDKMGIDFYQPLGWRERQDVTTMMAHMRPFFEILEDMNAVTGKRFMITETGHNGEDGRHLRPWTEGSSIDREEQANYLLAVFISAFKHRLIDGVVLYNTTCNYDITGTPAEEALRNAYSMLENGLDPSF